MPNLLKIKRGAAATIPQGALAEPLFTTDTYDLYIGKGSGGNQRFQKYIASGTSSQFLKGDGSLDSTSYQTALTFSSPLVNTSGTISIPAATSSVNGYLTSTDWSTFNSKEPAITASTTTKYYRGDKTFQTLDTSVVPENGPIYFTEPRVRATVLTGLNLSGGGTISATDSVLTAFGKVQNQISALVGGATYQGTWNASTNSPTLASGTGTKGYYYVVSVAGSTNLDGITDWKVGDWAIFNGTTWDKVDNTDAVSSVNGFTGAVNLGLGNISDVTLSSPTNTQLLRFNGTSSKWENWTPTYISAAITSLNGLTAATQTFATGTSGTDFAISSSTSTHTFNLPTASATNRGALSSADWTTFNNKQAALSGTINTIAYWDSATSIASLATATYPSLTELSYVKGVTSAIQTQLNAKEPTVTKGNLTEATSSVLTISGGTGAVIGSGTTIEVKSASATQNGIITTGTQTIAGAKTLTGALNGTSATFSGSVTATGLYGYYLKGRASDNYGAFGFYSNDGATRYGYIQSHSTNGGQINITADGGGTIILDNRGLNVTGAATFSSSVTAGDIFSTDGTRINFFGVSTGQNAGYVGTTTNHDLRFITNNTPKLTITSTGNVGIGTTSPISILSVAATSSTTDLGSTGLTIGGATTLTSGNVLMLNFTPIGANSNRARAGIGCEVGSDWGKGNLTFYTKDASSGAAMTTSDERMRITSGGDVEFNRSNATAYFYINQANSADGGLLFRRNNTNKFQYALSTPGDALLWYNYAAGSESMRITSGGEVLINTQTDSGDYKLQVNGNVYATAYYESSDIRLKDVISNTYSDTFSAIEFMWKDKRDEKKHWGYAAQDVIKFIPDAIEVNNDGMMTVNYNEAHTWKIAQLEAKILELEAKLK